MTATGEVVALLPSSAFEVWSAANPVRTSEKTVTFRRPFVLGGLDEAQPAGVYRVEMVEEILAGVTMSAYRRTETWIRLHENPDRPGVLQTVKVDPKDLADALVRDAALAGAPVKEKRAPGTIREWEA